MTSWFYVVVSARAISSREPVDAHYLRSSLRASHLDGRIEQLTVTSRENPRSSIVSATTGVHDR